MPPAVVSVIIVVVGGCGGPKGQCPRGCAFTAADSLFCRLVGTTMAPPTIVTALLALAMLAPALALNAAGQAVHAVTLHAGAPCEVDDAGSEWSVARDDATGVLDLTLVDEVAMACIAGQLVEARVWNRSYVAPTLRVEPGDRVRLKLVNHIGVPTNIHFHGLRVSPLSPGDNSFDVVAGNGSAHTYDFVVPKDHPEGFFWYHSHSMNDSQWQVFNGMAGAFLIGDRRRQLPSLAAANVTERILCLRNVHFTEDGELPWPHITLATPTVRLVNGHVTPTFTLQRNETALWRVANIGTDLMYHVAFDPPVAMHRLAVDGHQQTMLVTEYSHLLGPGSRTEFLVQAGPDVPAHVVFKTLAVDTGFDEFPEVVLADVTVLAAGTIAPLAVLPSPSEFPVLVDYRTYEVTNNRTIVLSDDVPEMRFYIDGKQFDMDRVDAHVRIGDIERWTIVNNSTEWHVCLAPSLVRTGARSGYPHRLTCQTDCPRACGLSLFRSTCLSIFTSISWSFRSSLLTVSRSRFSATRTRSWSWSASTTSLAWSPSSCRSWTGALSASSSTTATCCSTKTTA